MHLFEGEFAKYRSGYARVLIEFETDSKSTLVEIDLDKNDQWNKQLFEGNFNNWLEGAIYGAKFGLEIADISNVHIKIKRIVGQIVDTNSTTIAAATANAVWKAVSFEPSDSLTNHIEEIVAKSGIEQELVKFDYGKD